MRITILCICAVLISCQQRPPKPSNAPHPASHTTLNKTYVDPGPGYSQAVVTEANGIKTIYISGQVGSGPNFETQFRNSLENLFKTLENAGASFDDVVKFNSYFVVYLPQHLDIFRKLRNEAVRECRKQKVHHESQLNAKLSTNSDPKYFWKIVKTYLDGSSFNITVILVSSVLHENIPCLIQIFHFGVCPVLTIFHPSSQNTFDYFQSLCPFYVFTVSFSLFYCFTTSFS